MFDINLLGSISGQPVYSADDIIALLSSERTPLRFGTDFVGRPVTAIYRNGMTVAKLRTEFDWAPAVMEKWVRKTLSRERELGVHHPDKTWYLARCHEDDRFLIGNICPALKPLNQLLMDSPTDALESDRRLAWFDSLFRMYFAVGRQKGVRLDEGLSNFGLDEAGTLYYLDDDIYSWDEFVTLSHVIGTWFRAHAWFDAEFSERLGDLLREVLSADPLGTHYARAAAEQLRGLYMPQPDKREALEAFGAALVRRRGHQTTPRRSPPPANQARYLALLADIHANLPALDAVLEFFKGEGIGHGLVLGDIVGYGPFPAECIDRIAGSGFLAIKGNHDHAVATGNIAEGFSQASRRPLEWTQSVLSDSQRAWLDQLPLSLEGEGWLALHGSPIDPAYFNGYVYELTYEGNLDNLERRGIGLCFHGHSHIPAVYARLRNGLNACVTESTQNFGDYRYALVCPGSVGQPRNRQPGAQAAVWDRVEQRLRFVSLPYDIASTVARMRELGFADGLCQRLLTGL
ncbi:metallophosphoesterase family protein [Methylomagnum sp.]